jgi:hypothetical protein
MVAQAARRAHHDMRPVRKRAAFARGIGAANAGGDPPARIGIQPFQLAADLQRQFARGGDDQRQRRHRRASAHRRHQLRGHGHAEGHRLARTGLGGNQQVQPLGGLVQHGGLHGRGLGIAARGQRRGKGGGSREKGMAINKKGRYEQARTGQGRPDFGISARKGAATGRGRP